jgi:hypothetical protein
MNREERRGANLLSAAVVAVFILFGALGVATSGPPESRDGWVALVATRVRALAADRPAVAVQSAHDR